MCRLVAHDKYCQKHGLAWDNLWPTTKSDCLFVANVWIYQNQEQNKTNWRLILKYIYCVLCHKLFWTFEHNLNVWVFFLCTTAITNLPIPPLSTKIVSLNLRILGDQTQYRLSLVTMHRENSSASTLRCWPSCWWVQSSMWGLHPLWPFPCWKQESACGPSASRTPAGHTDRAVIGKNYILCTCNIFLDIIKWCLNSGDNHYIQPVCLENMLYCYSIFGSVSVHYRNNQMQNRNCHDNSCSCSASWFCPWVPNQWASVTGIDQLEVPQA